MAENSQEPIFPPPPEVILPPTDWFDRLIMIPLTRILPPPFNCSTAAEKARWKASLEEYRGRPVLEALVPGSVPAVTRSTAVTDGVIDRLIWAIDNYIPDCR